MKSRITRSISRTRAFLSLFTNSFGSLPINRSFQPNEKGFYPLIIKRIEFKGIGCLLADQKSFFGDLLSDPLDKVRGYS